MVDTGGPREESRQSDLRLHIQTRQCFPSSTELRPLGAGTCRPFGKTQEETPQGRLWTGDIHEVHKTTSTPTRLVLSRELGP